MPNNFIMYLMNNPDCLYIYNRDYSVYGLPKEEQYTIVVQDHGKCPDEFNNYDIFKYQIFKISDGFQMVLDGSIIPWECACLNKKYVIKEHVKLMMTVNPLKLRRDADEFKKEVYNCMGIGQEGPLIKFIVFANQIIENHKIINFKEPLCYYKKRETESLDEVLKGPYTKLKSLTDGILKQEIIKKANKNE